jgi:hypothetical protein
MLSQCPNSQKLPCKSCWVQDHEVNIVIHNLQLFQHRANPRPTHVPFHNISSFERSAVSHPRRCHHGSVAFNISGPVVPPSTTSTNLDLHPQSRLHCPAKRVIGSEGRLVRSFQWSPRHVVRLHLETLVGFWPTSPTIISWNIHPNLCYNVSCILCSTNCYWEHGINFSPSVIEHYEVKVAYTRLHITSSIWKVWYYMKTSIFMLLPRKDMVGTFS